MNLTSFESTVSVETGAICIETLKLVFEAVAAKKIKRSNLFSLSDIMLYFIKLKKIAEIFKIKYSNLYRWNPELYLSMPSAQTFLLL